MRTAALAISAIFGMRLSMVFSAMRASKCFARHARGARVFGNRGGHARRIG